MDRNRRLIARRIMAGMTQQELARAARVGRTTVGDAETGRHEIGVRAAIRIARALGTTVEALFGDEKNVEQP